MRVWFWFRSGIFAFANAIHKEKSRDLRGHFRVATRFGRWQIALAATVCTGDDHLKFGSSIKRRPIARHNAASAI